MALPHILQWFSFSKCNQQKLCDTLSLSICFPMVVVFFACLCPPLKKTLPTMNIFQVNWGLVTRGILGIINEEMDKSWLYQQNVCSPLEAQVAQGPPLDSAPQTVFPEGILTILSVEWQFPRSVYMGDRRTICYCLRYNMGLRMWEKSTLKDLD